MTACDHCGIDSNFLFLCSHCGGKFCKEHRHLSDHECTDKKIERDADPEDSSLSEMEQPISIDETEILEEETFPEKNKTDTGKETNLLRAHSQRTRELAVVLCAGLLIGFVSASIYGSAANNYKTDYETLKKNYNTILDNHAEILNNFTLMKTMNEDLINERDSIEQELELTKNNLEEKNSHFDILLKDYQELTEDWVNLSQNYLVSREMSKKWMMISSELNNSDVPSITNFENWIQDDYTDRLKESQDLTSTQIAVVLSLKAREKNWKMGLFLIHGTSLTGEDVVIPINVLETTPGVIYINPKTDDVWWNLDNSEIKVGDTLNYGEINNVYVNKINIIMEY